jgi:PGF-pre-PGF domain-containing protein
MRCEKVMRVNKKLLALPSFLIVFSLLSLIALAQPEKVNIWIGNVTIGTNSSTDGAIVGGYENGVLGADGTTTVGSGGVSGEYRLDVQCTAGNTMFLKVWGINATWQTCSNNFLNYTNLSVSLVASGGTCYYDSACSGNNVCCSGGSQVNDGTTAGTCSSSCAAAAPAPTGGGGGGGGGAGGVVPPVSETTAPQNVVAGGTGEFSITKEELLVTKVEVKVKDAVSNAKVTVREASKPAAAPVPITVAQGKVHKYLSITTTVSAASIEEVKISFSVPKLWFITNDLDHTTTQLVRYKNQAWEELETTLVGSDDGNYLFEATSPGLSTFAVIAKNQEKLTAIQLLDLIREFYAGTSPFTALQLLDKIRAFYGG